MATNILSIPQIPTVDLLPLQNDLHIGFGGDISKRVQKMRWSAEEPSTKVFPEPVDQLLEAFVQAQAAEDRAYVVAQGSDLTKQRLEKDRERDVLYKEIRKTVETFATLTIFPDKQEAAQQLLPVMQKYKIDPDGGIEAQTVATGQWLEEQLGNEELQTPSMVLGIRDGILQLKTLNDQIQQLTADRNDERAQKNTAELQKARLATDQAYRAMVLMVNAEAVCTTIEPTPQHYDLIYTEFIKSVQETIRYYRQLSDERRRQNKRVVVKSDIVGNHLYATVAGWTWERLIQDGKAALAVDQDASPARIVSTDKKALKAGGLQLALQGAAVAPTDVVDATREYELVGIG